MSEFNPQPKFEYLRSEKHLNAVRSLHCMNCGAEPRSHAAHSNSSMFGKGRGIKACDSSVVALCPNCHAGYDQTYHRESAQKWFTDLLTQQTIFLLLHGDLSKDAERLLKLRGVM